ncbi:MAG: D-alanyl-D-alanine carboxypeptidase [Ruminococcaceae bacterium]|nr:D-alanyl-D-alanine carboxypeptidase [Oscillospiraceae bacterium]
MLLYISRSKLFHGIICALLACILILSFPASVLAASITDSALALSENGLSANSAVLIEASEGRIIYSHNPNKPLPMASTTKIMTALVAIEKLPLDTVVTVVREAVGIEGSSVYLYEGEELTLDQLLYALMLESANDAAAAIAYAVAGGIDEFAALMNKKAEELGLVNTHFTNPHGLDEEGHYTTAYELAKITAAALENDFFREVVSTKKKTIPMRGGEGTRVLINHNKMLRSYEGAIGVKTGFTKKSGRCLVSAAERDGLTLIAVTIGAPDDWHDHTLMLDYGFASYESLTICADGQFTAPLWLVGGEAEYVIVKNQGELSCVLPKNCGEIRMTVEMPRFEFAPVREGDTVGRLIYSLYSGGEWITLGNVPLIVSYSVENNVPKLSLWEKIIDLFR